MPSLSKQEKASFGYAKIHQYTLVPHPRTAERPSPLAPIKSVHKGKIVVSTKERQLPLEFSGGQIPDGDRMHLLSYENFKRTGLAAGVNFDKYAEVVEEFSSHSMVHQARRIQTHLPNDLSKTLESAEFPFLILLTKLRDKIGIVTVSYGEQEDTTIEGAAPTTELIFMPML